MKKILFVTLSFALVGSAYAGIPLLNADCPGGVDVHAAEGGPIFINGKEGRLKKYNDNAFEARGAGFIISLTINPDGSPAVSYTGKGRANGVCHIKDDSGSVGPAPKLEKAVR
ncbi:hypothetical protein ACQCLI_32695 (plasmid) [Pseudomonas nitroreducens]|uniref:hypothetical protein n=1 Tax=Pseudomonas nitroreducens TaxID=46680 RepID=UPI003D051A24